MLKGLKIDPDIRDWILDNKINISWGPFGKYPCFTLNRKKHLLSRHIMGYPKNKEVDHIDGDPRNNLRSNLRVVTHAQNMLNRKTPINNKSGFKGVSWDKSENKWVAAIFHGKVRFRAKFKTIEEAKMYRLLLELYLYENFLRR